MVLRELSPTTFPLDKFDKYDDSIPLDKILFERYNTSANTLKLHDFFISWGFYDDEILLDIAKFTKNRVVDPDDDTTTDEFVRGVSDDGKHLLARCKLTFGSLPYTNVTNELTFSQMKAFHQHGQSDEALD